MLKVVILNVVAPTQPPHVEFFLQKLVVLIENEPKRGAITFLPKAIPQI
jgi:hypothetical protein